jgi:hypothetical protein
MIEKMHLTTIIFVTAIIWGMLLIFDGVLVSISWLRHLSIVTGALVVLLTVFDLYLWRLAIFRSWFVKRPLVDGTWKIRLQSNWIDPKTGQVKPAIDGFMVVRQTFSRMSLRLLTAESQSELLGAEVVRADDGSYRIIGVYRNEPRLGVRERSPIHYGGLVLQVIGSPPVRLTGHYWTDRDTKGEIALSDRRTAHVDDTIAGDELYTTSTR